MTRIVGIVSGKGGVGKTTLTTNLSYAIAQLGQEVIAIDANVTTPHLGLALGYQFVHKGLQNVLREGISLDDVVYSHPFGFKVIPSVLNVNELRDVDVGKLPEITLSLIGKADFVFLDCAPGLGKEATSAILSASEFLLVVNPEMPSVIDALRTASVIKSSNKEILGVVVNRIRGKSYELKKEEIESILGLHVLAEIPEDKNVQKSVSLKVPLLSLYPDSPAAIEIKRLAHLLCGFPFKARKPRLNLIQRLVGWMLKD
ncbi:MAG: cell division ATPase MinD [Candidatus Aenigmarchaeota archaeon]|nr:cell division ATPase MinD [Candidatus Aenigmarchaeota archaeon]